MPALLPSSVLFAVQTIIGRGSYATVYKGKDKETGKEVAIKIMNLTAFGDDAIEKLKTEITILKISRGCQYLPHFYGSYFFRDKFQKANLYIVMELCDAGSALDVLHKFFSHGGEMSEKVIAAILYQVLRGLKYLHHSKTMHRDIKCANILLKYSGEAKLGDFGVSATLTHTFELKCTQTGTVNWMAPELILEEPYTSNIDIWSLGITAIELADGEPPFSEYALTGAMFQIASPNNPPPNVKYPSFWTPTFRDLIKHCCVRDPSQRGTAKSTLSHDFFLENIKRKPALARKLVSHWIVETDKRAEHHPKKKRSKRRGKKPSNDTVVLESKLEKLSLASSLAKLDENKSSKKKSSKKKKIRKTSGM